MGRKKKKEEMLCRKNRGQALPFIHGSGLLLARLAGANEEAKGCGRDSRIVTSY